MTPASVASNSESQTVPQALFKHTSTLPAFVPSIVSVIESSSLTSPSVQLAKEVVEAERGKECKTTFIVTVY